MASWITFTRVYSPSREAASLLWTLNAEHKRGTTRSGLNERRNWGMSQMQPRRRRGRMHARRTRAGKNARRFSAVVKVERGKCQSRPRFAGRPDGVRVAS